MYCQLEDIDQSTAFVSTSATASSTIITAEITPTVDGSTIITGGYHGTTAATATPETSDYTANELIEAAPTGYAITLAEGDQTTAAAATAGFTWNSSAAIGLVAGAFAPVVAASTKIVRIGMKQVVT